MRTRIHVCFLYLYLCPPPHPPPPTQSSAGVYSDSITRDTAHRLTPTDETPSPWNQNTPWRRHEAVRRDGQRAAHRTRRKPPEGHCEWRVERGLSKQHRRLSCGRCLAHTPSIAFRHLPPKLKGGCRKPVLGVWILPTLRASLPGTFLQTLPHLVTPLKGHSLSPRSCPPTRSAPSERFRY